MDVIKTMRVKLTSTGESIDLNFKYTYPYDIQISPKADTSEFCDILGTVLNPFIDRLFENRFDYRAHGDINPPHELPDETTRIRTEEDAFLAMLPSLSDKNIFFVDDSASNVELFKHIITKGTEEALKQNKCATDFGILINHGMISVEDVTPPPPPEQQPESSDDSSNMKRPHEGSSADDGDDENDEAPDEKRQRTDEND